MLTAAPTHTTAAAMASPRSSPLTLFPAAAIAGAGRAAGAGAGPGRGAGADAPVATGRAGTEAGDVTPAAGGGGATVRGAPTDGGGAAADGAAGGGGPPAGNVGNLIVGAAVGLGGRLIRTVSFLGCTLPVSAFLGGTPGAGLGMFSAINFSLLTPNYGPSFGVSNCYWEKFATTDWP
jgi:hypothetical protein